MDSTGPVKAPLLPASLRAGNKAGHMIKEQDSTEKGQKIRALEAQILLKSQKPLDMGAVPSQATLKWVKEHMPEFVPVVPGAESATIDKVKEVLGFGPTSAA